jgi:hypothetical protein
MTNNEHKSELISLLTDLMKEIDLKPLHPKKKFSSTVAIRSFKTLMAFHYSMSIQKTWISERKCLDVPVNGLMYPFRDHLVAFT